MKLASHFSLSIVQLLSQPQPYTYSINEKVTSELNTGLLYAFIYGNVLYIHTLTTMTYYTSHIWIGINEPEIRLKRLQWKAHRQYGLEDIVEPLKRPCRKHDQGMPLRNSIAHK